MYFVINSLSPGEVHMASNNFVNIDSGNGLAPVSFFL